MEDMKVRVELWPLAADAAGLWLLSGDDAWRSANVTAGGEPHAEAEYLLVRKGTGMPTLLHSTSWRVDGPAVIVTYVAVLALDADQFALDRYPDAVPVHPALPEAVGTPPRVGAAEAPPVRYIDVLLHGLRHLAFLRGTDAVAALALDGWWATHLDGFAPALATMYQEVV